MREHLDAWVPTESDARAMRDSWVARGYSVRIIAPTEDDGSWMLCGYRNRP